MTIAAGFVTREGVLLCSDSQFGTQWDKTFEPKLYSRPIHDKTVSFAFAGSSDHARSIIEDCWEKLSILPADSGIAEFRMAIRTVTKRGAKDYFMNDGLAPEFLVGITTMSDAHLFLARGGAMPRIETCEFIGSGALLAHHLMKSLNPAIVDVVGLQGAAVIALSVLAAAKRSDPNCGGASQFLATSFGAALQFGPSPVDSSASHLDQYEYLVRNLYLSVAGHDDALFEANVSNFVSGIRDIRREMFAPGSLIRTILDHIKLVATKAQRQTTRVQTHQQSSPESPEGSDGA